MYLDESIKVPTLTHVFMYKSVSMTPFSRFVTLLVVICLLPIFLSAQSNSLRDFHSRNSFFVEGGGKAIFYSLNYERRYLISESHKIGVQVGVAPATGRVFFPVSINSITGAKAHQLETGLGLTFASESKVVTGRYNYHGLGEVNIIGTAHLGYRYQPSLGGLLVRVAYTPLFANVPEAPFEGLRFVHWFGICLGISLKNHNIN